VRVAGRGLRILRRYWVFAVISGCNAGSESASLNSDIQQIVASVSPARIAESLRQLEAFGTRNIHSGDLGPELGIDAARDWLVQEFQRYSPKLEVSLQRFNLPEGAGSGRVVRDLQLANVVAVLPGTVDPAHQILLTAHYDTIHLHRKRVPADAQRLEDLVQEQEMEQAHAREYVELFPADAVLGETDNEATAQEVQAPGVSDDGSGVAVLLELARILSQHEFEKTLVFVAFAAEEVGLEGSKSYASRAKADAAMIDAVLNNDIVGTTTAGNGFMADTTVRVFGDGPEDSPARALLRYTRQIAGQYVPSMNVQMIFRRDRFARGGDHTSFLTQGFAAVRFTSAAENYEQQHNAADTLANASPEYTADVARINAAVAASLALAPSSPVVNYTFPSGKRQGDRVPRLSRGASGYAASLRWSSVDADDIAGYTIVLRDTTAADWERAIPVGNVTRYTIEDLSIDDTVIGVKAVDRDGNESMVATYLEPIRQQLTAPPAESAPE